MSWVKNNTYGLLDRFQIRTRQEPFKFNQLDVDYNNYGESIWIQDERDELNYQLETMFNEMREWLGYYPRPIWKKIKVPLDQYLEYYEQVLTIPESAWLLNFGVKNSELLSAGLTYTKTPLTGLTLNVIFTLTIDEIDDGEIALYHVASDAFGETASENFRVYPTSIYYNGTSYIITVPYSRLIKPVLWNTQFINGDPLQRKGYDPLDTDNFVTELDVYRVYNDSTVKARLIGPPLDYTQDTTLLTKDCNVVLLESEESVFKAQGGVSVNFNPTHIEVYCYIGHPLTEQNLMLPVIEEFIIRKAKVEMGINARLASAKISTMWDFDEVPAYTPPDANSSRTGVGYRTNPVGARNVDVEMFKKLMPIANWRGKLLDTRLWSR